MTPGSDNQISESAPETADQILLCPQHHAGLRRTEPTLIDGIECGCRFRIFDGVPRFLAFDPVEDEPTAAKLAVLVDRARADGWLSALQQVYADEPNLIRYVTATSRARFLDLLPLNPEATVLEIGPGLGQFTAEIGQRSGWVHALEVVPEQAAFARLRCEQLGQRNVTIACGGDDCRLPYRDRSFDFVVLNLVLEWCASRIQSSTQQATQEFLIREIARVLKPGGMLSLATKNRFALHYLLGRRDEHAHQLRFGSALPRWMLQLLLAVKGKGRPGGLLHSHQALKRMLLRGGFSEARSYWAAPEPRWADHYVPTDSKSIRQARRQAGFVSGHSRATRLIMPWVPAPMVKHVTPGLFFIATKAN